MSEELKEWVKTVEDPDLGMSLVELGMIYKIEMQSDGKVEVEMTLTSPACPMAPWMIQQLKNRLKERAEVKEVEVRLVWEPKWDPLTMASPECKDKLGLW